MSPSLPMTAEQYRGVCDVVWPRGVTAAELAKVRRVWRDQVCTGRFGAASPPRRCAAQHSPPRAAVIPPVPPVLLQSFQFSDAPGAGIGFVQHENGPCGVLAATVAEIIVNIAFKHKPEGTDPRTVFLEPTRAVCEEGLTWALARYGMCRVFAACTCAREEAAPDSTLAQPRDWCSLSMLWRAAAGRKRTMTPADWAQESAYHPWCPSLLQPPCAALTAVVSCARRQGLRPTAGT